MRKSVLTVVITLTCLLGWGATARAQGADKIVSKVPFEFVAGDRTVLADTTA